MRWRLSTLQTALDDVYKICRLVYVSKRLEVAINFVHVLSKDIIQKFIELQKPVWIIGEAKMVFATTINLFE